MEILGSLDQRDDHCPLARPARRALRCVAPASGAVIVTLRSLRLSKQLPLQQRGEEIAVNPVLAEQRVVRRTTQ